jgi:hypothetical protein
MQRALRFAIGIPVLLLLAAAPPQGTQDTVTVTRKETKLRAQKRVFSKAVADLVEGDRVAVLRKDGAWYEGKWKDITGFLHEGDCTEKKDVRLSGQGVRETYSASEASAARKGFNPQVEQEYKQQNPDLAKAFAAVDQIAARKVGEDEVRKFLQDGGLWQEGGR